MHYKRKIEGDKNDVRCKSYFVYTCKMCEHEEWFTWVKNFDINRPRRCPKCGITEDGDDREYLIKRKQKLEQEIQERKEELADVSARLSVLETSNEGVRCG